MSFKVIERGTFAPVSALPAGQASIDRRGQCRLHAADLAKARITDSATVLADSETMRVGFRRPRSGEKAFHVCGENPKNKHRTDRRRIGVKAAIDELRLKPQDVAGRYALHFHEDVIFVCLEEPAPGEADEEDS